MPFDLRAHDIHIPALCPVLGLPLRWGGGYADRDTSPSVDRLVPSRGYVRSNILIVSFRANAVRYTATPDEIGRVAEFYRDLNIQ